MEFFDILTNIFKEETFTVLMILGLVFTTTFFIEVSNFLIYKKKLSSLTKNSFKTAITFLFLAIGIVFFILSHYYHKYDWENSQRNGYTIVDIKDEDLQKILIKDNAVIKFKGLYSIDVTIKTSKSGLKIEEYTVIPKGDINGSN